MYKSGFAAKCFVNTTLLNEHTTVSVWAYLKQIIYILNFKLQPHKNTGIIDVLQQVNSC